MKSKDKGVFMEAIYKIIKKLPKLFFGFFLAALGIVFMVEARIGMNPWGTFELGLTNVTGLSYGHITQIVGAVIIVLNFFMGIYPGIGTVLNIGIIGSLIHIFQKNLWIPTLSHWWSQLAFCMVGLIIFSFGVYFYLSCGLGAGPRDGLMLGLMKHTGKPTYQIKPAIEVTVLIFGYLVLNGPIGLGTIVVSLLGGPILEKVFFMFKFDPNRCEQQNIKMLIRNIKEV